MKQADELLLEIDGLRDRLSRLSAASLRINESLDLETVLGEVLESARTLTGARYGVIILVDDEARIQDFVTSGLSAEEHLQFSELPDGMRFFEYLNMIREPLRLRDFHSHIEEMGLPAFQAPMPVSPELTFMAAPLYHWDECVGVIYLGEKELEQEFTLEDEETLVMFATQAAMAISNARRFHDERRARTELETLVDTSPVGVVVSDVRTRVPKSLNREARRILEGLLEPDRPLEDLLELLMVRRADRREISLDEFSLTELFGAGEVVRAEEIVLYVPGGRSVTVLVNATPIRSEDGEMESFVVTLQDMTPLEEMERLRADFLAMVNHELQAPLASIRGSAATLLYDESDLDAAEMRQFFRIIEQEASRMRGLISDLLDVARIETGTLSVAPAPADLARLVDEARNTFLSSRVGSDLHIDLPPDLPWVVADHRRVVQVLSNLLSNAARHSPESSTIRVAAIREDIKVAVSVADDGVGVPAERLPHLFRRFYRLDGEDRGRVHGNSGLGLAICRGIVEAHGGRIWAESDGEGLGARFTFTLPVVEGAVIGGTVQPSAPSRRSDTRQKRVLAVDDDPQALRLIRDALSKAGYAPSVTGDLKEVFRLLEKEKPHLVLMDLMLPGTNGIELMREILETADVPVIFLSAYVQDDVVARALDMGAADYVVKPFSPTELAARIRAALRLREAAEAAEPPKPFLRGDLSIDYAEHRVAVAGRPVELTATEYDMLFELSVNAGRVLTHDHLLRRVWGPDNSGEAGLVRTIVKRLRQKLGDDAKDPRYVMTQPRVGYRMPKGEAVEPWQRVNTANP